MNSGNFAKGTNYKHKFIL